MPKQVEVHNVLTMGLAQATRLPGAVYATKFDALDGSGRARTVGDGDGDADDAGDAAAGGGAGAGAGAGAAAAGSASPRPANTQPEHMLIVCPNDLIVLRMVPLVLQVRERTETHTHTSQLAGTNTANNVCCRWLLWCRDGHQSMRKLWRCVST